uniref:Dimethylargininase n=1 Tax=Panagrolaimus sp. JU765 TaxID=591449 RepID=A0AC34QNA0_9BILA
MRYTHAIVVRIPAKVKFDDKKLGKTVDLIAARKEQEDLNETLREAGLEIIELAPDENTPEVFSLYPDDAAVVINGTALITRPKKGNVTRSQEIKLLLRDLAWKTLDTPETEHGKTVVLEGSDVLFTGKEIFVGIRKNGTNMEGALVVGRSFPDWPVVPIQMNGKMPLKYYVSVAADGVLTTCNEKEANNIKIKMEREASFRYKTLTLEKEDAVNCVSVNDHLIFRTDVGELKFGVLESPTELWGISAVELSKFGSPFSRFVLLFHFDYVKKYQKTEKLEIKVKKLSQKYRRGKWQRPTSTEGPGPDTDEIN